MPGSPIMPCFPCRPFRGQREVWIQELSFAICPQSNLIYDQTPQFPLSKHCILTRPTFHLCSESSLIMWPRPFVSGCVDVCAFPVY